MTNDVTLSLALRSNLLSLQNTQKHIDVHQNRLATGRKVNSALDNPQSFFTAQSLTNRASDLSSLLDAVSQSILTIQAASNGVTALTALINQQESIANTAASTLAGSSTTAKTVGTANLSNGSAKYTSLLGTKTGDRIVITVTDTAGTFTAGQSINARTITITANNTINDIISKANDLNTTLGLTVPAIKASLDSSGHLSFEAVNGGKLNVRFRAQTSNTATDLAEAAALGFGIISRSQQNGAAAANTTQDVTVLATNAITSKGLYTAVNKLAQGSTRLSALRNSTGAANTVSRLTQPNDTFTLSVNGKTSADLFHVAGATATTQTVQGLIDAINHDASVSSLVSASFNSATGQISLTPLTAAATDIQVSFKSGGTTNQRFALGLGTNAFINAAANGTSSEDIYFGAAAGTLASLLTQYNTGLAQIDALVSDTGYAGTNLLNGNSLMTYFDQSRKSSLLTSGLTFTSDALGLTTGNFESAASIGTALSQLQTALTTVRNFGSTLSTNLAIIQNRQTFTSSLINTLKTGADSLTNADQNTEGAVLLALQARQSLGVTALSLASQAQQATLKLF